MAKVRLLDANPCGSRLCSDDFDRNCLAPGLVAFWIVLRGEPNQGFFKVIKGPDFPAAQGADEGKHAGAVMRVAPVKNGKPLAVASCAVNP